MPELIESNTFVLVRGEDWSGEAASEPLEAGWAREAVIFLRPLKVTGDAGAAGVHVQISPDGIRWVDEGTTIPLAGVVDQVTFARVGGFGNWLRLRASFPDGAGAQMLVTVHLKG
jgi:hypothetical protein